MPRVRQWFKNPELVQYAFGVIADEKNLLKMAKEYVREIFELSLEILAIELRDGETAGFVNYITRHDREFYALVGIIIGDGANRYRGLGTEAMNLALYYLFFCVGVERVELDTAQFNTPAQKCFYKCGFVKYGEKTDINMMDGELIHKYLMKLYRRDFHNTLKERFPQKPIIKGEITPDKDWN